MTPAQLDRLRAIDAHLKYLLEDIAAKRTPGDWQYDTCSVISRCEIDDDEARRHADGGYYRIEAEGVPDSCKFIASCAGNAEAGWKATRAAISEVLQMHEAVMLWNKKGDAIEVATMLSVAAESIAEPILAAFPLESLNA